MKIIKLAAFAALSILPIQATWVDWTTITPTNQVNGAFGGGNGAYAGTIVATRSNVNEGINPGSPGLANGFLPMGTLFSLIDIDSRENLNNLIAFDANGLPINTPWLAQRPGLLGFLDASLLDSVDNTASLGTVLSSFSAGAYTFLGPDQNDSSSALFFFTTADISRMTYSTEHRLPGFVGGGGYNFAFGTDAVPEPSTYAMMAAGLLGAAYLKRRTKSN